MKDDAIMSNRLTSRTERLAEMERMLFRSAHGLRVMEIAEGCGVDRRTIYRDLDMMSAMGVPIWQEGGRYGIIREQYLATVRLTLHEAVALFIGARLLSRHADKQNPHTVAALTKLGMAVPEPLASHVAFTAETIRQYPVDRDFVEVLETVTTGWIEQRKVRIWYASRAADSNTAGSMEGPTPKTRGKTADKSRDFSPYFIEPTPQGGLYAIGFDDSHGEVRTLKCERIQKALLLDDHFEMPTNFNADEYFSTAWGIMGGRLSDEAGGRGPVKVSLHFSAEAAPLIKEHHWHVSQQLIDLPDGGCRLLVWVKEWRAMRPWIRSWGALVTVEKPEPLRQELSTEAAKIAAAYRA